MTKLQVVYSLTCCTGIDRAFSTFEMLCLFTVRVRNIQPCLRPRFTKPMNSKRHYIISHMLRFIQIGQNVETTDRNSFTRLSKV